MPDMTKCFKWAVVGAGPAGIAAVGKLLDQGIDPNAILWLDPAFTVGDLGNLWRNVSSNTSVARFMKFLHASASFRYTEAPGFALNHLPAEDTCTLKDIADPLQWVSNHLCQQVRCERTTIRQMVLTERKWSLSSDTQVFKARQVILATGAVASSLDYSDVDVIPFETAIDNHKLAQVIDPQHTYAVFGSSHSAIMIVRSLVEFGVKKVINFYRSPCRYAINMGEWILFDNTGLKGQTAAWAREHIDGILPSNLERFFVNEEHVSRYLPECDHVIYAVGFERRNNLVIGHTENPPYNPHVGIIGPGLFGLGIAYPQRKSDPTGHSESQIGLWKFMAYLEKVLPTWFQYPA